MSCPWRPPLETASDCPGQEALDKASYVGLYRPCRAGALAPRQLLKNHTASPREGPSWADKARGSKNLLRELIGESGRSRPELCGATQARRRHCAQSPLDVRETALPMPLDASALPALAPALLAQAIQFDIGSQIAGRTYWIFVQQPLSCAFLPTGSFTPITISSASQNRLHDLLAHYLYYFG